MNSVLTSKWTKVVLFLVCLIPLGNLLWGAYQTYTGADPNALSANPIEFITHKTGDWVIRFLLITLTITPLRLLTNQPVLTKYRRMFGLYAFFYAVLHFSVWFVLDKNFDFSEMWKDVLKRRFITVGMIGLTAMIPLAITSTAGWVRRLKYKRWQALHRLIYLSTAAGVIHYYWLVKSDIRMPVTYGAIFVALMLIRWVHARRNVPPARKPVPAAAS
jgi:methionine sulfoxide reductase heme-binding subunit